MAATQKQQVEQMRSVLAEMNTHPEARLFYSLQERGACGYPSDPDTPRLTLRVITDKVNKYMYPNLTAFVEDMTMIFSSCPSNTPLAMGAASLRELFTELLAKYTNALEAFDSTPPGKKKKLRSSSPVPFYEEEDEAGLFAIVDSEDEFAEIDSFAEDLLQTSDTAALLELTQEIASVQAEIRQLKEDDDSDSNSDSSHPGFTSHPSVLDALKTPAFISYSSSGFYSSVEEEGRVALSPQQNKKRARRNTNTKSKADEDWTTTPPATKKRTLSNRSAATKRKELQQFEQEMMTKEQLLATITNELPPKFLEGVIRIVNPTYDPATATDEDLEFDINLLDDDVLARLQQYVNTILRAPTQKRKIAPSKPQNTKVTHKKETPKKRLKKEAPKKVNRQKGSRKKTSYSKPKKQPTLLAATLAKRPFVSAELMKQIFMKEEIVRVEKSIADEDEEVDILD